MLWRIDETACNYPQSRCKFGLTQMKGNQFSLGTPRGVGWLWLVRTPPSKQAGSKKMCLHIDATKPLLCCMWGNLLKQALYKRNSEWYRTSLVYIFSWQWEEKSTMRVIGANKRAVFSRADAGAAKFMVQNKRQMKFKAGVWVWFGPVWSSAGLFSRPAGCVLRLGVWLSDT